MLHQGVALESTDIMCCLNYKINQKCFCCLGVPSFLPSKAQAQAFLPSNQKGHSGHLGAPLCVLSLRMKVDELESRHRSSVLRAQACYPLVLQFQCGDQTNPSDKKSYPNWLRLSEVILIMIHWILVDQFIVPIRSNNCSLLGPVNLWISRCYFLGVCKPARVSRTSMQGGPPKIANLVYNFVNWSYLGSMEERTNIVTVIRVYKPTRITLGYFVPKPSQTMAVLCSSILSHWRASLHIKGSKSNSWSSRVSGAGPKILGRTVSDYRNSIMSTPDS